MTTLDQIRDGLGHAWESLAEGWHHLRNRAAQALTRFHPVHRSGSTLETVEDQLIDHASPWGLLAAEVREDDDTVSVRLEVPGMEPENFDIAVDGRILTVRGEKRAERQERRGHYTLLECAYGRFERAVALPAEVDEAKARAKYRRGVLRIDLPKLRSGKRQRIEVQGS